MKFVYSLIRFVPDAARGEFINIGAIAGSDEAGEWGLRTVSNKKRARYLDERAVLGGVLSVVEGIERKLDLAESDVLFPASDRPSVAWLHQLAHEHNNLLQFSPPSPIVADNVEEVLDFAFRELILDLASPRKAYRDKGVAVNRARAAYSEVGLRDVIEKATVRGAHYHETFDFVVANGRAVQLAQAWSFQLTQPEELIRDIKAWAWTVRDIKTDGGVLIPQNNRQIEIPNNVDVAAIYLPPLEDSEPMNRALREAYNVVEDAGARFVPLGDVVPSVSVRARDLLAA